MVKKKILKIIVPILIILLTGSVWLLKNKGPDNVVQTAAKTQQDVQEENLGRQAQEDTEAEQATIQERIPMEYTAFDYEEFFSHGLPLLLDFGAASCGPCQMMKPDLTAFYEEAYGKVTVRYADVWEDASRTGGLPAMVVPTQYFFYSDGSPYKPSEEVAEKIYFYQYVYKDSGELALTSHQGILSKDEMYMIFEDMGAFK